MHEKILVFDFGSQYTQLIARRLRELNVYCEILPFSHTPNWDEQVRGVILSGSPASVNQENPPQPAFLLETCPVPLLGICYGAQWMAKHFGGEVARTEKREFGRASLIPLKHHALFEGLTDEPHNVWMSHSDSITRLPENFEAIARTSDIPVAAFAHTSRNWTGLQFHPEVYHSEKGREILSNFVRKICGCSGDWKPRTLIREITAQIREQIGNDGVAMALSGGVDSTVAAQILYNAAPQNFHGIFVDHGLLRLHEKEYVLDLYKQLGLPVQCIDASALFLERLRGISDPEQKRKIIGKTFIDVFQEAARKLPSIRFLGQGTIYPDVIESVSVHGPSVTIKSHHNVGGLPEKMELKVVEPLRSLFKDEVRLLGKELGIPEEFLMRHPFPGPGLAIRILGEISPEKVDCLQKADHIFISLLKSSGYYNRIWQAGVILLPVHSVGVMGDERTYEQVLALRAVTSTDGMTADVAELPFSLLKTISNEIINQVSGINRVVLDISSKPPATIEWE